MVQTGENYAQEQVEVDPQSETGALPGESDQAPAAGELGSSNAAGLFAAMNNVEGEVEQLERQEPPSDQIRVVAVQDVLTESEMDAFETTLADIEGDLPGFRDAAAGHPVISDAVERTGATTDDIVALDVLDEGVIVYTFAG